MVNMDMIANVLIVGSAGTFAFSAFLATIVFDKVSPDSTAYEPEIEMGMAAALTDQHIEVWMDAVLLIQTSVDIKNISKVDADGNLEAGSIVDLFPVGEPAVGRGTIELRIKTISKDQMPYLANLSREVTPMAYVREETLNSFMQSVVKLAAVGLQLFPAMMWLNVLFCFGCIGLGTILIFIDKGKTTVEEIDKDEDDDD